YLNAFKSETINLACALVVCTFPFARLPADAGTKNRLNAFTSSEPRIEQMLTQLSMAKPNSSLHR
ncbi:TPA: hypothetical protein ACXRYH_003809, partial [Klebsiella pneumoniae]